MIIVRCYWHIPVRLDGLARQIIFRDLTIIESWQRTLHWELANDKKYSRFFAKNSFRWSKFRANYLRINNCCFGDFVSLIIGNANIYPFSFIENCLFSFYFVIVVILGVMRNIDHPKSDHISHYYLFKLVLLGRLNDDDTCCLSQSLYILCRQPKWLGINNIFDFDFEQISQLFRRLII